MNRFFISFYAVCLALALVVVAGMQALKVVKRAKAKRLVAEAARHFRMNEFEETSVCLKAALKANWKSVEATKLTADLLEASGSPSAIAWRIRASQLQPSNVTNRLDWAQTAVKMRDLKSADDALSGLDEEARSTARYQKVAGALAWGQGKSQDAEEHYRQARKLEPDNPSNLLNLSTIGLTSTNEQVAAAARSTLQALAATNGPYSLDALRRLTQEATNRKDLPEALDYAREVATNSTASFGDRIDYLTLLSATRDPEARSWLEVLKREATNSTRVFALGRQLIQADGPTTTLLWLNSLPSSLQTNQPVPLVITDCQIAVKNWSGLLATVQNKEWGDSEILRLALESLARRRLGQDNDSQTLWKRARRNAARRLDRLYKLVQLTTAWDWAPERKSVLSEIVSEFPRERWAIDLLVNQLCDSGQTSELEQLVYNLSSADPSNLRLKISLARLYLLRKSQLPAAYGLAKEAFDTSPDDPLVLSTYAYSLLLQGKQDQAVRVLDNLKPSALQIPWVATCYGVIEARSGNKRAASEPLDHALTAKLLPEELELVRLAKAATN